MKEINIVVEADGEIYAIDLPQERLWTLLSLAEGMSEVSPLKKQVGGHRIKALKQHPTVASEGWG